MEPAPAALPGPLGVYAQRVEHHGNAGKPAESRLVLRAAVWTWCGHRMQDSGRFRCRDLNRPGQIHQNWHAGLNTMLWCFCCLYTWCFGPCSTLCEALSKRLQHVTIQTAVMTHTYYLYCIVLPNHVPVLLCTAQSATCTAQ
jgi:hypothetical protein